MIIKERRHSMNAAPTRASNKSQWQGGHQTKTEHGQANKSYVTTVRLALKLARLKY
jgi:hypothetical protein